MENYRGDVDATEFLDALGLGDKTPGAVGTPPLQEAFSGGFPDPAAGMGGLHMESEPQGAQGAQDGSQGDDILEALRGFVDASKRQVEAAQVLMQAIQNSRGS